MTKYFPDQPIVKGADVIYRPAGNAGEYAPLATNPYKGCGHGCKYCYVPNATHIDRKLFNAGAVFRPDYTRRLLRDVRRYREAGIGEGHPAEQIFITFSSDPYHPGSIEPTRGVIEILQDAGLAFCTLTKGGLKSMENIGLYRAGRDAYAASLTALDDRFSQKWEPDAALPYSRIGALRIAYEMGIFTWVSIEPTLSLEQSLEIVRSTHAFVNHYKIGKANYVKDAIKIDWRDYTLRMIDECQRLGVSHYIKQDLQEFLPPGYHNPLRVRQHH